MISLWISDLLISRHTWGVPEGRNHLSVWAASGPSVYAAWQCLAVRISGRQWSVPILWSTCWPVWGACASRLSSQSSWERLPIYKIERVENGCQMDAWYILVLWPSSTLTWQCTIHVYPFVDDVPIGAIFVLLSYCCRVELDRVLFHPNRKDQELSWSIKQLEILSHWVEQCWNMLRRWPKVGKPPVLRRISRQHVYFESQNLMSWGDQCLPVHDKSCLVREIFDLIYAPEVQNSWNFWCLMSPVEWHVWSPRSAVQSPTETVSWNLT